MKNIEVKMQEMDCKTSETVQTLLQTETFILGFILISQKIRMNKHE